MVGNALLLTIFNVLLHIFGIIFSNIISVPNVLQYSMQFVPYNIVATMF